MIQVGGKVEALREAVCNLRAEGKKIGLVPTMGYLHAGHLSLVGKSRSENGGTVVSIFVNPIQFGPNEDFDAYPRDIERDMRLLEEQGVDIVFRPAPGDIFAEGHSTYVTEEQVSLDLCGASRPGHFRGVCTIVLKLFNLVMPDRAYFGEKDFQQLQVIRRMVRDLNIPVEVRGCPIVREEDGLALSSRNVFLSPSERQSSLALSRSLMEAKKRFQAGENCAATLLEGVRDSLGKEGTLKVDYVELRNAADLSRIEKVEAPSVLALAVRVGKTRLIDNVLLGEVES